MGDQLTNEQLKRLKAIFKDYPSRNILVGEAAAGTMPQLNGQHGHILVYDPEGTKLSVYIWYNPITLVSKVKALLSIPGSELFTRGETEAVVHIPVTGLDKAADLIEARRKRVASQAQLEALVETRKKSPIGKKRSGNHPGKPATTVEEGGVKGN